MRITLAYQHIYQTDKSVFQAILSNVGSHPSAACLAPSEPQPAVTS